MRAGIGTKRVSGGTASRCRRARALSVYGTRSGPASSSRSATTISATAAPIPERAPRSGVTSIATVGRAVGGTEGCYHTSAGTLYLQSADERAPRRSGGSHVTVPAELPMTLVQTWGRSVQHDDSHDAVSRRLSRRAALQLGAGVGATAMAAPYLAHLGRRHARSRRRRRAAHVRAGTQLARSADRHPRAMGCERSAPQAGADLRRIRRRRSSCTTPEPRTTSPTTQACAGASSPTRPRASTSTSRTTG